MTNERFTRDYEISIQVGSFNVVIKPPIRIDFSAAKSISGQLNKMILNIYNLNSTRRLAIVKDVEDEIVIPISLFVGYHKRLELLFKGTISKSSNERNGADIITRINCLDGGSDFLNSFISKTVKKSDVAIDVLLESMPIITRGKITPRPVLTRPRVLVGTPSKLLDSMTDQDERWYVDNEKLYILKDNEVTGVYIPEVSAITGLISVPSREAKRVTFKILINSSIKIGSRIKLVSVIAPHLDGIYKIEDIEYNGDNYGDEWSQTCTAQLKTDMTVI